MRYLAQQRQRHVAVRDSRTTEINKQMLSEEPTLTPLVKECSEVRHKNTQTAYSGSIPMCSVEKRGLAIQGASIRIEPACQ